MLTSTEPRPQPTLSPKSPVGRSTPHESAALHVTGRAQYVDDAPALPGTLYVHVARSPVAHGRLTAVHTDVARAMPGVAVVLTAADIPGENQVGAAVHDEVLLAADLVEHVGQPVAIVAADSPAEAKAAADAITMDIDALEPVVRVTDAIEKGMFHGEPHVICVGDADAAIDASHLVLEGVTENGGQDHFYLETHAARAEPRDDGSVFVASSTQHPSEVQAKIGEVLGIGRHLVVVETPRMGGGFGGKETQAASPACFAAWVAQLTGRPARIRYDRETDMGTTGGRHPFHTRYKAGFTADGVLTGLIVDMVADGGFATDLSKAIVDRGLFHLDNAYRIPTARLMGRVAKTHKPSNTAFRGFGGPQGMLVTEQIMNAAAERLGMDPLAVRLANFYHPSGAPEAARENVAPYGQRIEDFRLHRLTTLLTERADYHGRRAMIEAFNASSPFKKRGIGFQPVKFGISFTLSFLNQAGALINMYADGSVQLSHGGTEMGQGLHTKMRAVAAHALGVLPENVRIVATATDKVPNTSATAASSGADLNGAAVEKAARTIRERLRPVAAELLAVGPEDAHLLRFEAGCVTDPESGRSLSMADLAGAAYVRQISLSSTGYYATPGIWYDHAAGRGKPFHYYAYGAAITEVELDTLTGEHRVVRADILHDVGQSLVPSIDKGQIEGGFVQGLGWLTGEAMLHSADGKVLTHGPSTYKVPSVGDIPDALHVELLEEAYQPGVIHGSKAVGEPPFMHGISALTALRHALGTTAPGQEVPLAVPATSEAILRAADALASRAGPQG